MNSAEKKAPEPSMDDIINSIRSIIADETQETPPVQNTPAVETQPAPVVQLTENQIADPVKEAPGEMTDATEMDAPVAAPAPEASPILVDTPVPSAQELAVANEIDAVPGIVAAPESPLAPAVQVEASTIPAAPPKLEVSEPLLPETAVKAPGANEPAAATPLTDTALPVTPVPAENQGPLTPPPTAMTPEAVTPVVTSTPAVEAPSTSALVAGKAEPSLAPEDDIVFAAPQPTQTLPDASLVQSIPPIATANDPVEEMIQSVETDQSDGDLTNNGIDPDQILAGMEASVAVQDPAPKAPIAEAPVAQQTPQEAVVAGDEPVVLDASKVTPEDAAAITAVAAATSEALTGADRSAPQSTPENKTAGNSLEDSVKAMLKPMIREWLDDNMPRILEGAIKEEVDPSGDDKS